MVLISSTHIKQVDKSKQTIVIYQNKVYDVTKFVTIHPGNLFLFTVCININILYSENSYCIYTYFYNIKKFYLKTKTLNVNIKRN